MSDTAQRVVAAAASGSSSEATQRRDILTIAEVAEELQVSTSHIAKLCQEGKLPHFRVSPRVIRIRRAALEEHIKQGERGA